MTLMRGMCDTTDEMLADERWQSPTVLYHYFTEDAELLYVGISNQVEDRDRAHFMKCRWRAIAALIHCQAFPTRRLAMAAEGLAIESLLPPFNIRGAVLSTNVAPCDAWFVESQGGVLTGIKPEWAALSHSYPFQWMKRCDAPWPDKTDLQLWLRQEPKARKKRMVA